MTVDEIVTQLRCQANPESLPGMARYGIATDNALGVSMPQLRQLARRTGRDHLLALELWSTGIHDARILASLVDTPDAVDDQQMEVWAGDFDSWDLCDQCVMNLFSRVPIAAAKALEWSTRPEEYVKRAGFVIIAHLASTHRTAADDYFEPFLTAIERESTDSRNYVKKGVTWALRAIGTRNELLHGQGTTVAVRLIQSNAPAARWIGRDALRDLTAKAAARRIRHHGSTSAPEASSILLVSSDNVRLSGQRKCPPCSF